MGSGGIMGSRKKLPKKKKKRKKREPAKHYWVHRRDLWDGSLRFGHIDPRDLIKVRIVR